MASFPAILGSYFSPTKHSLEFAPLWALKLVFFAVLPSLLKKSWSVRCAIPNAVRSRNTARGAHHPSPSKPSKTISCQSSVLFATRTGNYHEILYSVHQSSYAFIPLAVSRPCHALIGETGLVGLEARKKRSATEDTDDNDEWLEANDIEVISSELEEQENDDDDDWIPDRIKAQARKESARVYAEKIRAKDETTAEQSKEEKDSKNRPSPYTEEEEDIIAAMGGKTFNKNRKREWGFLGDSTLNEIATDYSVPVCYIADVLCMWGVPVPIDVHDRLGDLVTGEQAFALLEAVNSLDVAALHDRYSNTNLLQFCYEYDIPLQEAFEMAMKEGWSLPFGVQTCLRVEQEDELLRVLGQHMMESPIEAMDID
eukprot:scaffold4244_cov167-Amphora_coffeaeformis.AAC.23